MNVKFTETESTYKLPNIGVVPANEEEGEILRELTDVKNITDFIGDLASKHAECSLIDEISDKKYCKIILVALKYGLLDECVVLRLVSFIMYRFSDRRLQFRDRAAFLATALFERDAFDAREKKLFDEFKSFMKTSLFNTIRPAPEMFPGFREVKNERTALSHEDYINDNGNIYDEQFNPLHLYRALRILKEGTDLRALRAVHASFEDIINRTSSRVVTMYSSELFEQLLDLSHSELHNLQFKNFAILIKRLEALLDRALERIKETKSDVLKAYIMYSLLYLDEIASVQFRITLHLKFAELLLENDIIFDHISKSAMMALVENGKKLVEDLGTDTLPE